MNVFGEPTDIFLRYTQTQAEGPHWLTQGEAMTLRVAYASNGQMPPDQITTDEEASKIYGFLKEFGERMATEGLGDDETGKAIAAGYAHHSVAVLLLLKNRFNIEDN